MYKPHIRHCQGQSGLLLDDFVCHKSQDLKDKLESDNSQLYMIAPRYTGLLQPCDVTWMKTIRDEFPINIVQNSFTRCSYVFENQIDYSMDTESESDNE